MVLLTLEVAEGGPHVDHRVEGLLGVELAHVAPHELDVDAGLMRGLAGQLQRAWAQVEPGHAEPQAGQFHRDAPAAAGEVEDRRARLERELPDDELHLLASLLGPAQREVVEPL